MISFDEAIALIARIAGPLSKELISIGQAHGRTLAAPVHAQVRSPPFDASAMDGYAVREADVRETPATLPVVGESFAGSPYGESLRAGECVRIFTGAALPPGADRVVIQEDVERKASKACFSRPLSQARHVRRAGSDFERGELLLDVGTRLHPRSLVAAAAADVKELSVWRRPRVVVMSTGDELTEPGAARDTPGTIPESVSFGVAAMATDWCAESVRCDRLPDDLGEMKEAARRGIRDSNLIVITGGASVGERDFAKAMFEPLGLELIFSKLAIKPGKPVWFGQAGDAFVMGLPGNPTSALVTARLLLTPLLARLSGQPVEAALKWRKGTLATSLRQCGARETFHRAHWSGDCVAIIANQDSSAQKALAQADLLVRQLPEARPLKPGDTVDVLDF